MRSIALPQVGVAGWSYPHWEGLVYPKVRRGAAHALETLSQVVDAVEINTSFYRPIRPEYAKLWTRLVEGNPNFVFSAKLHQNFTHGRKFDASEVKTFQDGLSPIREAGRLGAVLMQFPWSFRYTPENRALLLELRKSFRQFPLVAELRHASWLGGDAQGTLIDARIGFCNIDQPSHTAAMPPTALLTSGIGYVRLHGRNPENSVAAYHAGAERQHQHDYLYSAEELAQWRLRIEKFRQFAERTMVIFNNDPKGKSVVNALQLQHLYDPSRELAPPTLQQQYKQILPGFQHVALEPSPGRMAAAAATAGQQQNLFQAA
jgi:uncharacterized protein YecE (DUF72 family)